MQRMFDLSISNVHGLKSHVNLSTLNMIFSATYYLELRNAIIVYCAYHFLQTMVKLVVWTL